MGAWLPALAALLSAIVTAYLGYRGTQAKSRADLTLQERQMLSQDAAVLRKELRDQLAQQRTEMADLRAEVEALRKRIRQLERDNDVLRDRLREAGIEEETP